MRSWIKGMLNDIRTNTNASTNNKINPSTTTSTNWNIFSKSNPSIFTNRNCDTDEKTPLLEAEQSIDKSSYLSSINFQVTPPQSNERVKTKKHHYSNF